MFTGFSQADAAIYNSHRRIAQPRHVDCPPRITTQWPRTSSSRSISKRLAEQQAELERNIAAVRADKKGEAIQKIKLLMAKLDITPAELEPTRNSNRTKSSTVKCKVTSGLSYRDLASGAMWSGRRRHPA